MHKVSISLEIYIPLQCQSKLFCSCPATYASQANLNVCPICLAYPGTMPSLNQQAPALAIRLGSALHCEIQAKSAFDRKCCNYPDLPKAYQLTQQLHPLMTGGYLDLQDSRIRLRQAHLEEDSASLSQNPSNTGLMLDFNRAGLALLSIITEADFSEASQVLEFIDLLNSTARDLGVAKGIMEKDAFRFDITILFSNEKEAEGAKVILKNFKSLSYVEKAINYEKMRQMEFIINGKQICNESRVFDQKKMETVLWRNGNYAQDYHYIPEPDLGILHLSRDEIRAYCGTDVKR